MTNEQSLQHKAVTVTSDDRCQHKQLLLLQAVAANTGSYYYFRQSLQHKAGKLFLLPRLPKPCVGSDVASFVALLLILLPGGL